MAFSRRSYTSTPLHCCGVVQYGYGNVFGMMDTCVVNTNSMPFGPG